MENEYAKKPNSKSIRSWRHMSGMPRAFKNKPLILTDYSQKQVDETVAILSKEDFDVSGIACNITDKKDIEKLPQFVADNGALKALIHIAGVSGTVKNLKKTYTIDLVATELFVNAFRKLENQIIKGS